MRLEARCRCVGALPGFNLLASRLVLPVTMALAFCGFAILYVEFPPTYFSLLAFLGLHPFHFPFLDLHALVAAIQCHGMGIDVYRSNPCDVLGRPHVYSPLFLELSALPITTHATAVAGIALSAFFFAVLATLPLPRDLFGWAVMILATLSPVTAYAIERGNNDLIVFILLALATHTMSRGLRVRVIGYGLVMLAAFLKFYPLTGMVAALRERPRQFWIIAAVASGVFAVFLFHYRADWVLVIALVPKGSYFTDLFGAVNLPYGLFELLAPVRKLHPGLTTLWSAMPGITLALLIADCLRRAVTLSAGADVHVHLANRSQSGFWPLIIGAALLVSCFFAGQSVDYRGILFLLLLPGLLAMRGPLARVSVQIVFLMWGGFLRHMVELCIPALGFSSHIEAVAESIFWLLRELVWWRVIGSLAGLVLCFTFNSDIGISAIKALSPHRKAAQ